MANTIPGAGKSHAGPSGNSVAVLDHVKMLAVEAHYLQANIASLQKSASSLNCGFQHILKMMSYGGPKEMLIEDNFWDFFSCEHINLQKCIDTEQANLWLDPQAYDFAETFCSGVETFDDSVSELDFCVSWQSGVKDSSCGDEVGHQDPVLDIASQSGFVNSTDVGMSKDSELAVSKTTDVEKLKVSKNQRLTDVFPGIQSNLSSLVWQASRLVAAR